MSAAQVWQIQTSGPEETVSLGERIGSRLRGGEVIELSSDLGGGKTTMMRGIARGAGSSDHVASPTFTISKEYDAGRLRIHHFDFYRLSGQDQAGSMAMELAEVIDDPANVVIIEWSDVVREVLPAEHAAVRIDRQASGEDDRKITMTAPASLAYLFDD